MVFIILNNRWTFFFPAPFFRTLFSDSFGTVLPEKTCYYMEVSSLFMGPKSVHDAMSEFAHDMHLVLGEQYHTAPSCHLREAPCPLPCTLEHITGTSLTLSLNLCVDPLEASGPVNVSMTSYTRTCLYAPSGSTHRVSFLLYTCVSLLDPDRPG